jgi:hypothetical protein
MFYLPLLFKKTLKNENVTRCSIWFLNLLSLLRKGHTEGIWEKGTEHHGWRYKNQMDGHNQVTSSIIIFNLGEILSQSRWPRGLRCVSAAARVVWLWVRIPLEACLSLVSVVLSVRCLCDGPIPRPDESYQACMRACVCHCVWLGAKITLYTYNEYIERGQYKKQR